MHRDLTPNNILLESSDSERDFTVNVKLVDFGLAKQRPNATVQRGVCFALTHQCGRHGLPQPSQFRHSGPAPCR